MVRQFCFFRYTQKAKLINSSVMKMISQYQVDAFSSCVFQGNPAAVCPLDAWLDDEVMQSIAAENNLAETAFFVKDGNDYAIRWFTPTVEVALCGHATLASAFVLFDQLGVEEDQVAFNSKSGVLTVTRKGQLLEMDFPSEVPEVVAVPRGLQKALGCDVVECAFNQDYIAVLDSEQTVAELTPNLTLLAEIECRGVIVTARSSSDDYDFVCRFFGPRAGIDEDPVTGSAFTKLAPFWSERLGQTHFKARQVSQRGGDVTCQLKGDRVMIAGEAVMFSKGQIYV